jgi:hypothetical protein
MDDRGIIADQTWQLDVPGGKGVRREYTVRVTEKMREGRNVFALKVERSDDPDESDSFFVAEVEP